MSELIGKPCLIVNGTTFRRDIHYITGVHHTHELMAFLDNDFDSLYHCKRALFISEDVDKLQQILKLQEDYLKAKVSLQYQLKCLESQYMKDLGVLRK